MKKWLVVVLLVPVFASFAHAQTGTKKRRPLPYEYGGVVIGNYSSNAGLSPVQFDHWLHRAKYTCRLCHVDIGFAMKANATGIKAADNMKGYYCGTCHNGKMAHGDRKIFEACATKYTKEDLKRCNRCHSKGENVKQDYDFAAFTAKFPKERFGNGIDWEKAEENGAHQADRFHRGRSPSNGLPSLPRRISPSRRKSKRCRRSSSPIKSTPCGTAANCATRRSSPQSRKGSTKYSMTEIFEGKYCGACHMSVAFPTTDCQRCHTKPVR